MPPETDTEILGRLIKKVKVAMLTTVQEDGTLRSSPMAAQGTPFDGDLWFFTSASSHTVRETHQKVRVNLSYANADDDEYVSVSGVAVLVQDRVKAKELWNPLMKAWFPRGVDDQDLALLRVRVEMAEYWDSPHAAAVTLAGFMVSGPGYERDDDNPEVHHREAPLQ